ncbi:MAG: ABC transporter ATP-binding protein [Alphaproteobacteria bacterium HGW-Alphaproteobacteria-2]|nr:MAG: ABC transporter ATP-binding protein [Alphaproteobacteria bacterium HGW-Alphaproteobacteria-2]
MAQLEVTGIETAYGMSTVLFGLSLEVGEGQVVGLLGRNGVGKTTTFRSIMGLTPPRTGSIRWNGTEITGKPPHEINRLGIGFVPEDRRIFPELTVWENLDIAMRAGRRASTWTLDKVYELFPDLVGLRDRKGGYLSGGQQQMLTIARSLMGNPELLLLDEPSEGLAPLVVRDLRHQIARMRDEGLSILLAEQNLGFVLALSDRVYILEKGEVKFSGRSDEVRDNPEIIKRYLTV